MKKKLIILLCLVGLVSVALWQFSRRPAKPVLTFNVEIVSLRQAGDSSGWRHITVRFQNGEERTIKTLTPFFFKPGYTARIGVYERFLFPDIYDFVSQSAGDAAL